jgi:hypothetical protein
MHFRKTAGVVAGLVVLGVALILGGCSAQRTNRINYPMGEKVPIGPLTYTVVETEWKTQLGDGVLKVRSPQQRFQLVTMAVTNGGGKDVALPLFSLEDSNGKLFPESENGESVDNWLGLLRNIAPAQTLQGRLLFDVQLGSYKLRVTDGGDPGTEKYAYVEIPLKMDSDAPVQAPTPGSLLK